MASVRFNVTFPPEVLDRVDVYCRKTGIPRSSLLQIAVSQYLDSVEAMPDVKKMFAAMAALVDGSFRGEISPTVAKERFDSISSTYTALTGRDVFTCKKVSDDGNDSSSSGV